MWNLSCILSSYEEASIILGIENDLSQLLSSLGIHIPERIGIEGYLIEVRPDKCFVIAKSNKGVFYGIQTLRQLIYVKESSILIPCVLIIDYPTYSFRGFTDDISRGPVPKLTFAKRMLEVLAEFKLNAFTHYTELHAFKFPSHPDTVWHDYLTPEEAKELVKYSRKLFINYFPSIQSFGHSKIILSNPKYSSMSEYPGSSLLSPAKPEVYKFLEDIYKDICSIFNSRIFNVNCDETWDLGKGASREVCSKKGIGQVYLEHILALKRILDGLDRKLMFWGDIVLRHKEVVEKIPKDVIVLNWRYDARSSYDDIIEPFWRAGLTQIICPGIWCWRRIFPDFKEAQENISNFSRDGLRYSALGVLTTSWDDDGENLQSLNWYGLLLAAEAAWNGIISEDFYERFDWAFFRSKTNVGKAIKLLSDKISRKLLNLNISFWMNPFKSIAHISLLAHEAEEAKDYVEKALNIISRARNEVYRNKDYLDYLEFAILRLKHVIRKVIVTYRLITAIDLMRNVDKALKETIQVFKELLDEVEMLEEKHKELWIRESKPNSFEKIVAPRYTAYKKLLTRIVKELEKLDPREASIPKLIIELGSLETVPYTFMTT